MSPEIEKETIEGGTDVSNSNARGETIDYDLWRRIFASTSPACPAIRKM